jgi:hypothetical protein
MNPEEREEIKLIIAKEIRDVIKEEVRPMIDAALSPLTATVCSIKENARIIERSLNDPESGLTYRMTKQEMLTNGIDQRQEKNTEVLELNAAKLSRWTGAVSVLGVVFTAAIGALLRKVLL